MSEDEKPVLQQEVYTETNSAPEDADHFVKVGEYKPFTPTEREVKQLKRIEVLTQERDVFKKQNKVLIKQAVTGDHVMETIEKAMPRQAPPKILTPLNADKDRTPLTGIALWSDHHIGQVVTPNQTAGFGGYDLETWIARIGHMTDTIIAILRDTSHPIERLVIGLMGDMVNGMIHDVMENDIGSPMAHALGGATVIAAALRQLAEHVEVIDVPCVVGNHGRLKVQPHFGADKAIWNLDYAMYHAIKGALADVPNVNLDISLAHTAEFEVYGDVWLLLHGDTVKSQSKFPITAIDKLIASLSELYAIRKEHINYWAMGHFHHTTWVQRSAGGVFVNGSTKGSDEFTHQKISTGNRAQQYFITVHPEHGLLAHHPINLGHIWAGEDLPYEWPFEEHGLTREHARVIR